MEFELAMDANGWRQDETQMRQAWIRALDRPAKTQFVITEKAKGKNRSLTDLMKDLILSHYERTQGYMDVAASYLTMHRQESETYHEYSLRAQCLGMMLGMETSMVRAAFTQGLTNSERLLLTQSRLLEDPEWTIEQAVAYMTRVQTAEARVTGEAGRSDNVRTVAAVMPTPGAGAYRGGGSNGAALTAAVADGCWECGSLDHRRGDCPQYQERMRNLPAGAHLTCYSCGERGHRSFTCPLKDKAAKGELECEKCGPGSHATKACKKLRWEKRRADFRRRS